MSAINNALSELSKSQTVAKMGLEKAQIQVVKRTKVVPWILGGFSLSLAVGGWAVSQQPMPVSSPSNEMILSDPVLTNVPAPSPTAKLVQASNAIYDAPVRLVTPVVEPLLENTEVVNTPASSVKVVQTHAIFPPLQQVEEQDLPVDHVLLAKVETVASVKTVETSLPKSPLEATVGEVIVEQVELTPTQLAEKAQSRAKKALDANDLSSAINHYSDALRYTPRDSKIRQTLVALFYGKGEVRKAVDLLQKGISFDQDDMSLRISLAKLLIKEKQNTAALAPLVYLPANPTSEYLSLRAALAQKSGQDELALHSYQQLVQVAPENGRWWLGLGIQLERAFELPQASEAYQQALNKVGLSSQSQQFIRDRLALLSQMGEQPNAN